MAATKSSTEFYPRRNHLRLADKKVHDNYSFEDFPLAWGRHAVIFCFVRKDENATIDQLNILHSLGTSNHVAAQHKHVTFLDTITSARHIYTTFMQSLNNPIKLVKAQKMRLTTQLKTLALKDGTLSHISGLIQESPRVFQTILNICRPVENKDLNVISSITPFM